MTRLTFDIASIPPSAAAIALVRAHQKFKHNILLGLLITAVLTFTYTSWQAPGQQLWALLTLGSVFVLLAGSIWVATTAPDYDKVSPVNCTELLKFCESTPEGKLYRDRVLEQGREFVMEEAYAMEKWSKSAEARRACKELYDIPT